MSHVCTNYCARTLASCRMRTVSSGLQKRASATVTLMPRSRSICVELEGKALVSDNARESREIGLRCRV